MAGEGEQIGAIDKNVKTFIDKTYPKKRILLWKSVLPYAIAASLLLFGLVYFMQKPTPSQITVAEKSKQIVSIQTQNTLPRNEITSAEVTENKPKTPSVKDKIKDIAAVEPSTTVAATGSVSVTQAPTTSVYDIKNDALGVTKSSNISMGYEDKEPVANNEKTTNNAPNTTQLFDKTLKYFYAQDFEKAIINCKEILKIEPNDQDALYFLGLSERGRGYDQNAITPFTKIEAQSEHYDDAQFQLARSCLKMNKLEKAKTILKLLAARKNPKQTEAYELLKNLGN